MSKSLCESALYGLLRDERTQNMEIKLHQNSNRWALIIDPRFDDMMEAVIRNFMYYMNPKGWNLLIVSWSGYKEIITKKFPTCIFGAIADELIVKDARGIPNITLETYNNLLLNADFWRNLPGDFITIFQKDCIMFNMFPDYFVLYDFSGANWYAENNTLFNDGINGGFSIRNRKTMIECIEKVNFDMIEQYRRNALTNDSIIFKTLSDRQREFLQRPLSKRNEDVFFSYACEILHKMIPDILHRAFLAIEANIYKETCVYHGWQHNYHSVSTIQAFLDKSELFAKRA